MKMRLNLFNLSYRKFIMVLALCGLVFADGCAATNPGSGTYGRLNRNREVSQIFRSYEILPDHRYYYSGSDAYPSVVIGIHKDYTLVAKFWKPVDITPGILQSWLGWSRESLGLYYYKIEGSYIVGGKGQQVGVWFPYRNHEAWGLVTVYPDNTVNIKTPSHDEPRRIRVRD